MTTAPCPITESGEFFVGHAADFDALVLANLPEVRATALRLTGRAAEADDLVQEAVMRAWQFWGRHEEGTNTRAWMHRIVVNTFISGYRKTRREREVLGNVHAEASHLRAESTGVPGEGVGDEVRRALSRLPKDYREVVVLVDLEDCSYRDAAEALACPIGTVMSRLHRGRKAMARELRRYAEQLGYGAGGPSLEAA